MMAVDDKKPPANPLRGEVHRKIHPSWGEISLTPEQSLSSRNRHPYQRQRERLLWVQVYRR